MRMASLKQLALVEVCPRGARRWDPIGGLGDVRYAERHRERDRRPSAAWCGDLVVEVFLLGRGARSGVNAGPAASSCFVPVDVVGEARDVLITDLMRIGR